MSTSKLYTPLQIGKIGELKNRVVMAPMTRSRADLKTGVPGDLPATYYAQRAGAGMILSEGTHTSNMAKGWNGAAGIYTEEQAEGWKKSVKAVEEKGGLLVCQLWHQGRESHSEFHDGKLPLAPSAIKIEGGHAHTPSLEKKDHEVPKAMDDEDIKNLLEEFKNSTKLAMAAGFHGVELHAANGYLLNQFLDSRANKRTDKYGGSPENNSRLVLESLDAVISVIGKEKVGIRLSPNGLFNDVGSEDFVAVYDYVIEEIFKRDIAFLDILDGLAFGFHKLGDPYTLKQVRAIQKKVGNTATAVLGGCGYDAAAAEAAVDSGDADGIVIGRPYIANPDLVNMFKNKVELKEGDGATYYTFEAKGYTDYE